VITDLSTPGIDRYRIWLCCAQSTSWCTRYNALLVVIGSRVCACVCVCSLSVVQMFLIHQPDDDGTPSVYPQFNTIERNLMIANYNSQEAVDNDDGSGKKTVSCFAPRFGF
jgi:hypothetical protein